MTKLPPDISKNNVYSLLWHASFLAFARTFMDVDTIVPAMLIEAGGSAMHVGVMTAIMLGGASFTQLIFAPFISNYEYKKKFLLIGINARILALFLLGLMLYFSGLLHGNFTILFIFILITIFSLSGAFSNISYTDILGKSVDQSFRKSFFSTRQVITGIILLLSAFLARKVITLNSFPANYASMFFIASLALFVASLGFWRINEHLPSRLLVRNIRHFFKLIKSELSRNNKLGYFLGFINTMGISIALMPFIMLYAKQMFHTGSAQTGMFLIFKVLGSVSVGFILITIFKKFKYKYLLYGNVLLVSLVVSILLFYPGQPPFYLLFLMGGVIFASYSISMNGILLEVSGIENRALYTGIAGAGNILPALFPLIGGWIIEQYGFREFFVFYIILILSSLFFIYKLNCKK